MLIWGNKTKTQLAGFAVGDCAYCRQERLFGVLHRSKKFSLYFVPVLTYSKQLIPICATCGVEGSLAPGAPIFADERTATAQLMRSVSGPKAVAPGRVADTVVARFYDKPNLSAEEQLEADISVQAGAGRVLQEAARLSANAIVAVFTDVVFEERRWGRRVVPRSRSPTVATHSSPSWTYEIE